ncbi:MAG: shikimate kinase [bacterium]|nr:shikimate kinase [bacterium]
MKIIFIGFMGAGKSFFSKRFAEHLGLERVETDELAIKKSGRASIKEIFEKDGEIRFRELEIETAKELQEKDNVVIDTGGGVVLNKIILDYLRKDGVVIFLKSSLPAIEERFKDDEARPLWKDKEKFRQFYELRLPLYQQYADVEVDTSSPILFSPDGKSQEMTKGAEKILEEIIKKIKAINF